MGMRFEKYRIAPFHIRMSQSFFNFYFGYEDSMFSWKVNFDTRKERKVDQNYVTEFYTQNLVVYILKVVDNSITSDLKLMRFQC